MHWSYRSIVLSACPFVTVAVAKLRPHDVGLLRRREKVGITVDSR